MIDQPSDSPDLSMPLPVSKIARRRAQAYADQYFIPDTREIYLNTLSVLIADTYFQMLNFPTNLIRAERWNAAYRLWGGAAELELVGLGNIECRTVRAGQATIILPPDTWDDRIGYLFIEIAASEKVAKLLGFLPAVSLRISEAEVIINDLQSIDQMIDYLTDLENSSSTSFQTTYLRSWLNNIYRMDWEPAIRDLNVATGQKKISLAKQIFVLLVSVSQGNDELTCIRVTVRAESGFLPRGLKVSVPDEYDIHTEIVNEPADLIVIPLEFLAGAEFWVELQMEADSVKEYFIA
jgi:Protein of unknown function (DUF1822)